MTVEREITGPIDIADAAGRLQRAAIGWARHPLIQCNLPRELPRVARWNYWCLTTRECALTLLIADVGYVSGVLVSFLDLQRPRPVDRLHVIPGRLPGRGLGDSPRDDFAIDARRLRLAMRARGEEMIVEGEARPILGPRVTIRLVVDRPRAHETLTVLVPWDDTHFQLTSKQQALPVRGVVRVGDREYAFDPDRNDGFACLDYGRGRWPRQIEWNWAFGSMRRGGHTIGLNLGGVWTDGTGVTENGLVIDGRLHKIAEPVDFRFDRRDFLRPWSLVTRGSERLRLRFTPCTERVVKLPLGVIDVGLHQHMGHFSGIFVDDDGKRQVIEQMVGLAEWQTARFF